jgi:CRP-like cAMP-binding protein
VSFNSVGDVAILLYVTEGNLIGDSALFNRMPVYAVFSAVEDADLVFFPRELIEKRILIRYPELQKTLLEYMAYKVGVLLHHQCEVVSDDVFGKVSRLIYDIAKHSGFARVIPLKITQEEMATALGIHRATFSRVISELKRSGALDWTKKHEVVIHDYETIRRHADSVFAL